MNDVAKNSKKQKVVVDIKSPEKPEGMGKKKKNWPLIVGAALLVILALGTAFFFYKKYQDVKNNPVQAVEQKNSAETQRVLTALKKTLLITETESPTVARIEDPEKLKSSNPEFYKDIKAGDYLIIYPKRAIVYREADDQIINLAPIVNVNNLQKAVTSEATTSTESSETE